MPAVQVTSAVEWNPSPIIALATSVDDTQVAAAREDGSLEIWAVSPGSVNWHCQLTVHGNPSSRISSLAWCRSAKPGSGSPRLLSSSIDGSVYEWDLFNLQQEVVLDTVGVSIWQMAVSPKTQALNGYLNGHANGHVNGIKDDNLVDSEDDDDDATPGHQESSTDEAPVVALACDDGCVRMYIVTESGKLVYKRSLPRVTGRTLSVTWSSDGGLIYTGSSDGFIRCWNANSSHEIYRINAGDRSVGSGSEICVWSLLALRNGSLVSADSSGSVQFWDSRHGTLLQKYTPHKGDASALAAVPGHDRVFSAGSDGQIILFTLSKEDDTDASFGSIKWSYVHYVRAHTHDVKALTVAVPITRNDSVIREKKKRIRGRKKPVEYSYYKWAEAEVPMLLSAGDDTKLLAYPANDFTKFSPHDVCPAPQRVPIQFVPDTDFNQIPLLLCQSSHYLDISQVSETKVPISGKSSVFRCKSANMTLLARVKCKQNQKIVCSTISSSGKFIAYSDNQRAVLLELISEVQNNTWNIQRKKLPKGLPNASSLAFTPDSTQLIVAGRGKIYVIDIEKSEKVHTFTPRRQETADNVPPSEPAITKLLISLNGVWLASVNCFGDIYIFNLKTLRQHWFVSRLGGSSVTAAGFLPMKSNILVVITSSNQVYMINVDLKQLGDQFSLPMKFLEFPGETFGLSFKHSGSCAVVYSERAMCRINFGTSLAVVDGCKLINSEDSASKKRVFGMLKRNWDDFESKTHLVGLEKFNFGAFKDPVLFMGYIFRKTIFVVAKPWMEVVKTFDAPPVHRHIYGT